jgi:hypothetical protein
MHFIIYNKASGIISQVRHDSSTGETPAPSVWLEQHCSLCGLTLNDYSITQVENIPAFVMPAKYIYIESTQQFQENPNYVVPPPIEPPVTPPQ